MVNARTFALDGLRQSEKIVLVSQLKGETLPIRVALFDCYLAGREHGWKGVGEIWAALVAARYIRNNGLYWTLTGTVLRNHPELQVWTKFLNRNSYKDAADEATVIYNDIFDRYADRENLRQATLWMRAAILTAGWLHTRIVHARNLPAPEMAPETATLIVLEMNKLLYLIDTANATLYGDENLTARRYELVDYIITAIEADWIGDPHDTSN